MILTQDQIIYVRRKLDEILRDSSEDWCSCNEGDFGNIFEGQKEEVIDHITNMILNL